MGGLLHRFLPPDDRYAALILYGMVLATCFNGYDAGIMTVILADKQFISYYNVDATKSGVIATIPWASTGSYPPYIFTSLHVSAEAYGMSTTRSGTAFPRRHTGQLARPAVGAAHLDDDYDSGRVGIY